MTAHEGDERPEEEEGDPQYANSARTPLPHPRADDDADNPETGRDDGDDGAPQYATYHPGTSGPVLPPLPWDEEDWRPGTVLSLDESREPDDISPPGWVVRAINHLAFYVVVMSIIPAFMWLIYASVTPEAQKFYIWPAGITTGFSVLVVFLRYARGSVMQARRDMRAFLRNDQINGINPSNRLAQRVFSDQDSAEKVVWESRLHPISVLFGGLGRMQSKWRRRIVGGALLLIGALAVNNATWLWLLIGAVSAYIGFLFIEWSRDYYALTNERITSVTGLFTTKVALMPLVRVTDVVVNTSALSNILAWMRFIYLPYAMFDVESAGQDQALKYINYVPAGDVVAAVFGLGKIPS